MPASTIYTKLVQSPSDTVGALAYALYKQRKVAYIAEIESKDKRAPTPEEMAAFHKQNALDDQIRAYRSEAEALAAEFLRVGLANRLATAEQDARDNAREAALRVELKTVAGRITEVKQSVDQRRTFSGWIADAFGNLLVNFLTIAIVGAVVLGIKTLDKYTSKAETGVGISEESQETHGSPSKLPPNGASGTQPASSSG
ncbi:hypothetical protein [Paraburkholderia sediminicola]|uniref:hypothetical protein n=1 Tax=Paraburkholderia sediminicola TaxID=458836 RepID=UPI0038BBE07A